MKLFVVITILLAAASASVKPARAACAYGQTCDNTAPQYVCVGSGGTAFTPPTGVTCHWVFPGPRA